MLRQFSLALLLSSLAVLGGCQTSFPEPLASIIAAHDADPETTTIVIKRLSDNKTWINQSERAKTRYIPASTSKIPHTLIALETQLAEPETLFNWDGRERWSEGWNQDLTLAQAYKRSAVWVYQDMTRSLGPEVMTDWLTRFAYGNHDIGDADNIDMYWLTGPLKISSLEQVSFLTQLAQKDLLLSEAAYQKSQGIFENESQGVHTLYAKTGWMHDEQAMDIGWFVGWVAVKNTPEIYVFALNMDMPNEGDFRKRKPIVMDALQYIGAWPE